MKAFPKRTVVFLTVLCLLVSLAIPALAAPSATNVVTTPTGYQSAADVVYAKTNGIIANWGARGEVCTFLSSYATDFYTGSNTFAELAKLSGGTASTADDSALYDALQKLMRENHTTYTSYGSSYDHNCKSYYLYTDCVSSDTSKVSLLYRGTLVSSKWDSGNTYNQEHMWPNSKCKSDNEVGDIMHLRPANPTENSTRGNKAYGESGGYYDPGVSVRGDCARTMLYMYVRWGNTGLWGSDGVMENLSILLKWMEEDPVDTWEMGRNDSVESITGTRNVFVDYPELAFLLFNTSVPEGMVTPSNEKVPEGGTTTPDLPDQPDQPEQPDTGKTAVLVSDASSLKAGDQIIIVAAGYDKALSTTQNNNNRGAAEITKSADKTEVTFGDDVQIITLKAGTVNGTLAFHVGDSGYLYAASSSKNYLRTKTALDANGSWSIRISNGVATILASGSNTRNCLTYNQGNDLFACYQQSTPQKPVSIYKLACKHDYDAEVVAPTCTKGGYTTYTCSKCGDSYVGDEVKASGHNYKTTVTAPTCTKEGYTTFACSKCSVSFVGNKVKATGHSYKNGRCSGCGAKDPAYKEPVVTEPVVTEPVVTEPVVTEPVVTEPVVTEPVVTEPIVTEPVVTEPAVTDPVVTEPAVTDPVVTEPVVTDPVVTEPTVTEPVVTEPTVTDPAVTDPAVTDPEVTNPTDTEPADTDPEVTNPTDTEPADTDPEDPKPAEEPKSNPLVLILIVVVILASAAAGVVIYIRKKKSA